MTELQWATANLFKLNSQKLMVPEWASLEPWTKTKHRWWHSIGYNEGEAVNTSPFPLVIIKKVEENPIEVKCRTIQDLTDPYYSALRSKERSEDYVASLIKNARKETYSDFKSTVVEE